MRGQLQFPEEPEKKESRFSIDKQLQENETFVLRGADGTEIIVADLRGSTMINVYESGAEIPLAVINAIKKSK